MHEYSCRALRVITDTCLNLHTIEISIRREFFEIEKSSRDWGVSDCGSSRAISMLDEHFKEIPSLKHVLINGDSKGPFCLGDFKLDMKNCGWTLREFDRFASPENG